MLVSHRKMYQIFIQHIAGRAQSLRGYFFHSSDGYLKRLLTGFSAGPVAQWHPVAQGCRFLHTGLRQEPVFSSHLQLPGTPGEGCPRFAALDGKPPSVVVDRIPDHGKTGSGPA